MSWMHGRQQQHHHQQQQQGPITPAIQTSSAAFGGVQQQQQCQTHNFNHKVSGSNQNQNNWLNNSSTSQVNRVTQQNWEQQSLQSPSLIQQATPSLSQKHQQPLVDNYFQRQQQILQSVPHQYKNSTSQQMQNKQSTLHPNGTPASQQIIKPEQGSSQSQKLDVFDNQGSDGWSDWDWNDNAQMVQNNGNNRNTQNSNKNLIEDSFSSEINDNWQWNIEDNSTKSDLNVQQKAHQHFQQQRTQHPFQSQQKTENLQKTELLSKPIQKETVSTISSQSSGAILTQGLEELNFKSSNSSQADFIQTMQPISQYGHQDQVATQVMRPQSIQQTVNSTPVPNIQQYQIQQQQEQYQQQRNFQLSPEYSIENTQNPSNIYAQTSKSVENIQISSGKTNSSVPQLKSIENAQNTVGSPVYVSQAKPVSQPPRQYAVTPLVSGEVTPLQQGNAVEMTPFVSGKSVHQSNSNTQSAAIFGNLPPHPISSQSPGLANLPPPPSQTPPQSSSTIASLPPPPPISQNAPASVSANPYKRAGIAQHHRSFIAASKNSGQPTMMPSQFYPPPEEFQSQQNQEYFAPDNSEIVDRNYEVENQEVAPNNDRNQYLQTSHLSEEDYSSNRQNANNFQEQNSEIDNFPPPGLSRLVLGQPEIENQSSSLNQPEIPPGFDRMIPGTELAASDLNMERQADGQDTIPSPRSVFTNVPPVEENISTNMDVTSDRNLYHVPGESDVQVQRVVTGVENGPLNQGSEQREVELDGENLEDQHQFQPSQGYQHDGEITRDEPIEGANTLDGVISQNQNHETESSLTVETNLKDLSNASTGNDESDHRDRHTSGYIKSRKSDEKKRRPLTTEASSDRRKDRYETEESDFSSEREGRRYREGSVRNDRDKDNKDRDRREKRESRERDRYRDRDEKDRDGKRYDRERHREKYDRERDRAGYGIRYETDSKYETESSMRYERRRGDRDRDKERDRDSYGNDYRRDEKDRRYRRDRHERDDRRRGDRDYRDYRDDRSDRRRDRDNRDKNRSDYDDDYRKGTGRNIRESDREKDKLREKDLRYQHMYGYPPGFGYDPFTYYQQQHYQQQQQYYEQLRRNNPEAYSEIYRKWAMYGQLPHDMMATDGRESVHSGRSSANNDKDRQDNLSLNLIDGASSIQEPQRSTPCKFTNEHATGSMSAGLLVCVKPKYSQNGVTNIVKVLKLGVNDSTRRLFQSFPGPLIRGLTHKKTIIEFCEDQIRLGPPAITMRSRQNSMSSICSLGQPNKASFTLIWNLLILLLRQNGMVEGTDIAELLMKNKLQYPYEGSSSLSKSSSVSRRDSVQSDIKKSKENSPSAEENEISSDDDNKGDRICDNYRSKQLLTEEEITEKFRNYLLCGNVNEALDWATENNLWGHALFLASKVDRRSHANVMMKFANKLALNDPLQTLYQLMSGRTPSSVTCVQDEKWGDWRPHLAMILSNTFQKPELNRKAITTLGDSLYNRGDIFGAQFCYLVAQVEFGRYSSVNQDSTLIPNSNNAVRLVLLGSSQHKVFREFATNEAIMMTEIYEYACSLNEEKFSIVEFQPYKYLLALRMLDYGFQLKTLTYMEQVSLHIQRNPTKYDPAFIEKVYNLADRLKFYDPILEKTMDDHQNIESTPNWSNHSQLGVNLEEQKWLQDLRSILQEANAFNHNNNYDVSQQYSTTGGIVDKAIIDQQFTEINQQFSELSMKYNNYDPMRQTTNDYTTSSEMQYKQELSVQNQENSSTDMYSQYYNGNQNFSSIPPQSIGTQDSNLRYESNVVQNDYSAQYQQVSYEQQQQVSLINQDIQQVNNYWDQQQQQQQLQNEPEEKREINKTYQDDSSINVLNNSTINNNNKTSNTTHNNNNFDTETKNSINKQYMRLSPSLPSKQEGSIDEITKTKQSQNYVVNKKIIEEKSKCIEDIPRPTISMPNSLSNKPGFYDDSSKIEGMSAAHSTHSKPSTDPKKISTTSIKNESKVQSKSSSNTSTNSGWFGGIWNKLSLKPKNQMILPDDKNPTIVWDSEKKKWVNTEGDENEEENFKPPPKISDLVSTQNSYNHDNQNQQTISNTVPQITPNQQQATTAFGQNTSSAVTNVPQPAPSPMSAAAANVNTLNSSVEPTKTPSLQSNMFKMQRNRTLKKSYVDVFNPSGAPPSKPVESVLAPTIPPAAVPQSGFFIPAPVPNDNSQRQQPSEDGVPQFYNPNQFGGYQQ